MLDTVQSACDLIAELGYATDNPADMESEQEALADLIAVTTDLIAALTGSWGFLLQIYSDSVFPAELRAQIAALSQEGTEAKMLAEGWTQNADGAWVAPK